MNAQMLLVSPTLGDHLENLLLLGTGLLIFVLTLVVCDFVVSEIGRILKASRERLENKCGKRKAQPDPFPRYDARLRRAPSSLSR